MALRRKNEDGGGLCFKSKPRKSSFQSPTTRFPTLFYYFSKCNRCPTTSNWQKKHLKSVPLIYSFRYYSFPFSIWIFMRLFWPEAFIIKHTLFHDTRKTFVGFCASTFVASISPCLSNGGHWCFPVQSSQMEFFFLQLLLLLLIRENPWLPHPFLPP